MTAVVVSAVVRTYRHTLRVGWAQIMLCYILRYAMLWYVMLFGMSCYNIILSSVIYYITPCYITLFIIYNII